MPKNILGLKIDVNFCHEPAYLTGTQLIYYLVIPIYLLQTL